MLYELASVAAVLGPLFVSGACPFILQGTPPDGTADVPETSVYNDALNELDISAVFNDLYELMSDSQECWPADEFNGRASYGPLFIRLAWHCSGSYRSTDGLGGCAGGRQRFQPESAWPDNTNLDKARALLYPIKAKHGDALSWGDLFVFSGTAAIMHMGGPIAAVCAGRIDDEDGSASSDLPFAWYTADDIEACNVDGNCTEPLGSDTIGLIYVNPAGVLGDPVPAKSAPRIREVFGRMDFNDSEVVALIGGGHAFGKCHGACATGPGEGPDAAPYNPWDSTCGVETVTTSGFEGAWTNTPLRWSNEFFTQLINDNYTLVYNNDNPQWENVNNGLLMLTTDLALVNDDDYYQIVAEFAEDIEALETAFAAAWQKLTESGAESGWASNKFCIDGHELATDYVPRGRGGKGRRRRKQRRARGSADVRIGGELGGDMTLITPPTDRPTETETTVNTDTDTDTDASVLTWINVGTVSLRQAALLVMLVMLAALSVMACRAGKCRKTRYAKVQLHEDSEQVTQSEAEEILHASD